MNQSLINAIRNKVEEINDALPTFSLLENDISLTHGSTGISLFQLNYSLFKETTDVSKKLDDYFDYTFSILQNNSALIKSYSFSNGYSGIIWYYNYLYSRNIVQDDYLQELEKNLFDLSLIDLKKGDFDYLHAGLGLTLSVLERKADLSKERIEYLKMVIRALDENKKIINEEGIAWYSEHFDRDNPNPIINLSLSHGLSSIIMILCKLYDTGVENNKVKVLLEGAVSFFFSVEKNESSCNSLYPSICDDKGIPLVKETRLGWCYGDISFGIALWKAGNTLLSERIKDAALEILIATTKRRDLDVDFVRDACLCHGSSGLLHIFNRLYLETQLEEFNLAREFWANETLKFAHFPDGLAGFKTWNEKNSFNNDHGFLEGIAGIGLSLIGFLSENPKFLDWDRTLLIS